MNRYAYANGNPVSFVDPFGLEAMRGNLEEWHEDFLELFQLFLMLGWDQEQFEEDFNNLTILDASGALLINDDMRKALYAAFKDYISSAKRPKGMGKREWNRLTKAANSQLDDVLGKSSFLARSLKILPYITIGFDAAINGYKNWKNGESWKEIGTDAMLDIGLGATGAILSNLVSGMVVGAVSGSVVPGVGNLIGMVAGIGVGILFYISTEVVEYNDTSFVEWIDSII